MLNEKSVTVAIHDELVSIRQRLMEKDYSQLGSISIALEFIEDVLVESHPSGYPDPIFLGCIASLLRDEKFRDRRENQCTTPLSTDIQTLIDRLKKLRTQAEAARPQKMRRGDKGTDFLLVCILFLSLILTIALNL